MTPTLLIAVMIVYTLDTCSGAIDTGVTVYGQTVGPNYHRPEGIRRFLMIGEELIHKLI